MPRGGRRSQWCGYHYGAPKRLLALQRSAAGAEEEAALDLPMFVEEPRG